MNILFQDDYFPDEQKIWEKYGATVIHGLCDEKHIKEFAPVVARGTIAFDRSATQALRYKGWPDLKWPFQNPLHQYDYNYLLNCSDLLNDDAVVFTNIGVNYYDSPMFVLLDRVIVDKSWIRSNSGSKQFSGGVFDRREFIKEVEYLTQKGMTDLGFVVASPKTLGREWRIVIVGDEIQSSSQYMDKGEPEVRTFFMTPDPVLEFANAWIKKHTMMFPNSYVLDICEHEDQLKVVEVNNILTSGWYGCDIDLIVSQIIHLASNP